MGALSAVSGVTTNAVGAATLATYMYVSDDFHVTLAHNVVNATACYIYYSPTGPGGTGICALIAAKVFDHMTFIQSVFFFLLPVPAGPDGE